MEQNNRDPTYDQSRERTRDRTRPRKRRFDSGPDPNKIKESLKSGRTRDYEQASSSSSKPLYSSSGPSLPPKPITQFVGSDKHAKRAYIGNIPSDTDFADLLSFLNISMREAGGCIMEGNPVLNTSFTNIEKRFMFVELRTVTETTCIMQLDGIVYRNHSLKVRRPVDYEKGGAVPPEYPVPKLNLAKLGIISSQVEDSDLKLYVGGLPPSMGEDHIKLILGRYGKLKSFRLVKEKDEIISKGYAF